MDMHEGSRCRVALKRVSQLVARDIHEMVREGVSAHSYGGTLPIGHTDAVNLATLEVVWINCNIAPGSYPYNFGEIVEGHGVRHL